MTEIRDLMLLRHNSAHACPAVRDLIRRKLTNVEEKIAALQQVHSELTRALRKLVGPTLGPDELAQAVSELSSRSHSAIARRHGVDRRRTPLLLGGALILSEVQRRLVVPLEVVGAGLREGALVRSLDAVAA